ncbi:MAG: site-specific DNA-methyltransferase [Planctomycetes bacterium]|nr:site-specific DNA-methyltransferase [Planctomycetota bacterium]
MSKIELIQGDCLEKMKYIPDGSVDMILADLPYGITACKWDSVLPLDKLWEQYKRVIKENGAIVLTAAQPFAWRLCASNPKWFKYEIIWEKPNGTNPMLVKKQPFRTHENVLVFYKKQPTYNPQMTYGHSNYSGFYDDTKIIGEAYNGSEKKLISKHKKNTDGSRYPRSVQRFAQDRSGHPTKKPVELMEWLIKTYTNVDDIILDNTMGEGTTGVACVKNKRNFIGIELDPEYFKKAEKQINEIYNLKKGF